MYTPLSTLIPVKTDFPTVRRGSLQTLQVNVGYLCNQACKHCHVNAGPKRTEVMTKDTSDAVIEFLDRSEVRQLDLTGGAPELNPHFRRLVLAARARNIEVIDRCNLTVLAEPGQEDLAVFLAEQDVEVVASLPCYLEKMLTNNVARVYFPVALLLFGALMPLGTVKWAAA